MSEVFGFEAQHPVQSAAQKDIKPMLIPVYRPGETTLLRDQLLECRQQSDRQGMEQASMTLLASDRFISVVASLSIPLAQIDVWLRDRDNTVAPGDIVNHIKSLTGTPKDLVATVPYKDDRLQLADSLVALTVCASHREQLGSELLRALCLCGLIEALAAGTLPAGGNGNDHGDDNHNAQGGSEAESVYRLLTKGIVALPSDIFPLPPATITTSGANGPG